MGFYTEIDNNAIWNACYQPSSSADTYIEKQSFICSVCEIDQSMF